MRGEDAPLQLWPERMWRRGQASGPDLVPEVTRH